MSKLKDYLQTRKNNMSTTGEYIRRYRAIYFTTLVLVALFEVFMTCYMAFRLTQRYSVYGVIYICSYVVLFVTSVATAVVTALSQKKQIKSYTLSVIMYVYVIIILLWATTVSGVDIIKGHYPIVYLTIVMVIGSITFIDSLIFLLSTGATFSAIVALSAIYQPNNSVGYYINILVFVIMATIVAYRNYKISLLEERKQIHYKEIAEFDVLTGLKSNNSYHGLVKDLKAKIKNGEKVEFTVTMIDLNLLKNTNDRFGHQYGDFLLQTASQTVRKIFIDSQVFRIGGDEFVAISIEDKDKVPQYIEEFDKLLDYSTLSYNGKKLILSVSRGSSEYRQGDKFEDVLERADKEMYSYKKVLKEKYGFTDR